MDLEFRIYKYLFNAPPTWRRLQAKVAYELISKGMPTVLSRRLQAPSGVETPSDDMQAMNSTFMNYGYTDAGFEENPITLKPHQEPARFPIQLYHHVVASSAWRASTFSRWVPGAVAAAPTWRNT